MAEKRDDSSSLKDQFKRLRDNQLPKLMFGIEVTDRLDSGYLPYNFLPKWKFKNIVHQVGGMSSRLLYFQGKLLRVHPEYQNRIDNINKSYFGSKFTAAVITLDDILGYQAHLDVLSDGMWGCQKSFNDFQEGIYPLDFSWRLVDTVSQTRIPKDLGRMVDWVSNRGVEEHNVNDFDTGCWGLWILGNNSRYRLDGRDFGLALP